MTLLSLRIPDFDAAIRTAVEPRLADRLVVATISFKPLGRVPAASPEARASGIEIEMPYRGKRERQFR